MKEQAKKIHIRITPKVIVFAVVLLWGLSLWGTWTIAQKLSLKNGNSYPLLNPRLKTFGLDNPEARNSKLFATLVPLKQEVLDNLGEDRKDTAFYVEDLNSGSWVGWQEREPFIAASLLKTPIAIAAMKKIENGEWSLETEFIMESMFKDKNFGELWKVRDGEKLNVRRLLEEMLQNSDNTASILFLNKLTSEELDNVYYHIGVANPEGQLLEISENLKISKLSAKDHASVFRALYNATYLRRQSSNYILELLTNTRFDEVVPNSVPDNIKVAHKIGNFYNPDPTRPKQYHDCGITYYPEHPYLYCVMTQNFDAKTSEGVITKTNGLIYQFFDKNKNIK